MSSIAELFDIRGKECIAFMGSGGKTSLMFQLASALVRGGKRVISTTTTRILIPQPKQSPQWMLLEGKQAEVREFWEKRGNKIPHVTLGWTESGGKLCAISEETLEEIFSWSCLDALLVETDGSRGKSLKGYRDDEPVIPHFAAKVIIAAGLDAIGKPFGDEVVHRPEIVEKRVPIKSGDEINSSHITQLLLGENSYLEKGGAARKILVLNRINTEQQERCALEIAKEITNRRSDVTILLRGPLFGFESGTEYYGIKPGKPAS